MEIPQFEAVIIANGEYPQATEAVNVVRNTPFVACCDGGANEYIARGNCPDIIIGDGDSLSEENRRKYGNILLQIKINISRADSRNYH